MTVNELIGALGRFGGMTQVAIEITELGKPAGHPDNHFFTPVDVMEHRELGAVLIAPQATSRKMPD